MVAGRRRRSDDEEDEEKMIVVLADGSSECELLWDEDVEREKKIAIAVFADTHVIT